MANRQIATILSLRDRMSRPLIGVSRNVQNVSREMRQAQNQVRRWGRTTTQTVDNMARNTAKAATAMAGVVGGLAVKTGFSEAFDMEGYKVQLETAVKDTKKAGILMANAVKFANRTPFETGEVVEATAKMEAYGISSKRWLKDIADMAGATNKSIDQGTEAMADAAIGEFERMKEFGIRKDDIMLESAKRYGEGVVFDAKGHMLDQAKMMDVLQSMMQEKFKGGADKLAGTAKGLWSTVTGVTKSSLAKIVGMQEDGTIKQGSLYMQLKDQIKQAADQLQKWQQDGTFERIGKQVTETAKRIIKTIKGIFNFVKKHKEVIKFILVIVATIYTVVKAINIAKKAMMALQTVSLILNGTLALSPMGWVVAGITAAVAAGYLLYKNWDKIKKQAKELKNKIIDLKDDAVQSLRDAIDKVKEKFKDWEPVIKTIAKVLTVVLGPAIIKTGVRAVITGAQVVGSMGMSFLRTATMALWLNGVLLADLIRTFIRTSLEAAKTAAVITGQFIVSLVRTGLEAIKTAAIITGQLVVGMVRYALSGWRVVSAIGATVIAWGIQKTTMLASAAVTGAMTLAQWALNAAMMAAPYMWIIAAVVGVIAIGVLLYKNWDKIKAKAFELWEGIKEAFTPIGEFISGIWDGIKSGFKGFINFIIEGVNKVIRGINKLQFKVPDWIPVVGGKDVGINIPEIPKFARGGISTRPAIFGEAGPEIAIPLKRTRRSQGLLSQANRIIGKSDRGNTRIINHTKNIGYKHENRQPINLYIHGNIYGEQDFINRIKDSLTDIVATTIVEEKALAKANMA